MTYDHNDYLVDNDDDEYLTSILVDINSRYYVLFSSNGDEKKVECDTVEDFMRVLELVRTVTRTWYSIVTLLSPPKRR